MKEIVIKEANKEKKGGRIMKGYKAFNKNLTCRGMQYEIGKSYKLDGKLQICKNGFHFCKTIADCYKYYDMSEDTRICEVKVTGNVITDDNVKFCTDEICIKREIKNPREKTNVSNSCSGYCNSGNRNSGNYNSGNYNSGDCNSGNCNSGDCNSGDCNSGNCNSGNRNSGNCNSGNRNSGYCNSGNRNSGNYNSGNYNSGDCNSGDWNSGNRNSGVFNTDKMPKIKMFDKESEWTIQDWAHSKAYDVLGQCPYTHSDFIYERQMSDEEKENHPEYKTIGGYIKNIVVTKEDKQKWWDGLSKECKQSIYDLPNFNKNKFKECTEIEV